jgi:hypothetical protein
MGHLLTSISSPGPVGSAANSGHRDNRRIGQLGVISGLMHRSNT